MQGHLTGEMLWSLPVVIDCLRDAYQRRVPDAAGAARLTRLHARAWQALLVDDIAVFEFERHLLFEELADMGLSEQEATEADVATIKELTAIVAARFRRAPRVARNYFEVLSQLAARLPLRSRVLAV